MSEIKVPSELWASSLMPEGVIEKWLVADGTPVKLGAAIVAVRIEDALHELLAPAAGRVTMELKDGGIVDPGRVIGHID